MAETAIAVEHLTKRYGAQRGIEDVSLRVDAGEIFGFIGPNGAGKSTTIRLLLGLVKPNQGTAHIFGQPVGLASQRIKAQIGYLPAEVHYYGDMTVKGLLQYSAGFYGEQALGDLGDLAQRLDVDLGRRIDGLSLGNRKKVGILQALLHRPRLLILDEPTSGLDPLIQNRLFDLLTEFNANGTTIFFSSHVLSEVQRFCHRVAILKEGRVVAVEQVGALRTHAVKKINIEWQRSDDAWLPEGARDIQADGCRTSFLYPDEPASLLASLGQRSQAVRDITIEQPSLEEVFMHFYGEEDA